MGVELAVELDQVSDGVVFDGLQHAVYVAGEDLVGHVVQADVGRAGVVEVLPAAQLVELAVARLGRVAPCLGLVGGDAGRERIGVPVGQLALLSLHQPMQVVIFVLLASLRCVGPDLLNTLSRSPPDPVIVFGHECMRRSGGRHYGIAPAPALMITAVGARARSPSSSSLPPCRGTIASGTQECIHWTTRIAHLMEQLGLHEEHGYV